MARKSKKLKKEPKLYYFHSMGCAFCKQIDPIVEELNNNGHEILRLDLSEKDNQGLKQEIENKYNLRCGTPWLVDASNGNSICGMREKEIIKKWAEGEKVPEPPKPKTPAPPFPMNNPTDKDFEDWKEKYNVWKKENNHLPNLQTAEFIIDRFNQQREAHKTRTNSMEARMFTLENKLDKLMNHLGVK